MWRGFHIWLRASLWPAAPLGLILIAACWSAVALVTLVERERTVEGAIKQTDALVRLFEENTVQRLLRIDRTLLLLRQSAEADPKHFDLRNWAERTALIGSETIQMSIIESDGFMGPTTTDYHGPPLFLGDREHFLAQVDTSADNLFISRPMLGRASGKWSIQLSRRLRGKDGSFGGIIIASLDPDFLQRFYDSIDLGSHGIVILRNLDGIILAAPGASYTAGRKFLQPEFRRALALGPAGHFWGSGTLDGVNRLIGYRVSDKLPIIVSVGRAESDIFRNYRHNRNTYLVLAAVFTILVLIAVAGCTQYKLRLNRVRDNLRRSEAQAHERARELELKSRELEVTLECMGQGIIMADADGNVLVTNRQAITLLGLPETFRTGYPITDTHLLDLLKPEVDDIAVGTPDPSTQEAVTSGATPERVQVYQRTQPDGTVLEIHNALLQDGGTVRTIADVTDRKRAEFEIVHVAHHDSLTGLANRVLLHERIDQAFSRARRHQESFAILCLDLDRFKITNDAHGHQAGDVLLRQVADRLRNCARGVDTVARVGGDEFVLLQANVVRPEDVIPLAERVLQVVSEPYEVNGGPIGISASIGIAMAPADGANADELLGHADLALYRAKADGRNDFCFFDMKMRQSSTARIKLELELRAALARDEFELWYQPWVNIISGKIVGCEALLRWRHPTRGLVGPLEFIPIAEDTGLIVRLGQWVLTRACRDAAKWPSHIKLAINLSAAQFIGSDLPEAVFNALADSGFEARRLELEITESLMISDYEKPREALRQLRNRGVSIALDDFGTGYSSLTHLRQLLINRIKIDQSFVAEMTTRPECASIVSAVITLGKSLGLGITAEGVETHDQLVILRAAGCTEAQGYLFSRPKPAAEILGILSGDGGTVVVAA